MRIRLHGGAGGISIVCENSGIPQGDAGIICMLPLIMLPTTVFMRQRCFIAVQHHFESILSFFVYT